jgi:riboflavin kinase/FMN adenylyltransferase
MIIHQDIHNLKINNPVVTIGVFDGVHQGHLTILNKLVQVAKEKKGASVVITLWPHPRIVLNKDKHSLRLLNTIDEKKFLLAQTKIDHLIIVPFTKEFANLMACEFIEQYLVDKIGVKHLVVGYNHHFGKDRKVGYAFLKECAQKYGFEIEKLEAKLVDNDSISSTKIREFLTSGQLDYANKYLGYEYFITGDVVQGNQVGRKIGFPTANIKVPEPYKQIPRDGVYAVRIKLNGDSFQGMLNIGTRPTVSPTLRDKNIEVHIFDFNQKIYHQKITVFFVQRIRDEKKFNGLDELEAQLQKDKQEVLKIFYHA